MAAERVFEEILQAIAIGVSIVSAMGAVLMRAKVRHAPLLDWRVSAGDGHRRRVVLGVSLIDHIGTELVAAGRWWCPFNGEGRGGICAKQDVVRVEADGIERVVPGDDMGDERDHRVRCDRGT